jgi:hypothetical protein
MPLGDSITEAETGHASYRYWLWHELVDGGFDVDFVGTLYGVHGGPPLYEDFDQNHEGHWGWRADEVLQFIQQWAVAEQPEVVLMHLGHNDLWQGQGVDSTIDDLAGIVGELRSVEPTITVLLAQVIPSTQHEFDEIPELNAAIALLAVQLDTPSSRVIAVDHWTGFDPVADTYDGTHPNEGGERKMSARWLTALAEVVEPRWMIFQDGFESGELDAWGGGLPAVCRRPRVPRRSGRPSEESVPDTDLDSCSRSPQSALGLSLTSSSPVIRSGVGHLVLTYRSRRPVILRWTIPVGDSLASAGLQRDSCL